MGQNRGLDRRYAFFRFLLTPVLKWYFGYRFDELAAVEAPYFLLANHNTDLDAVFIGIAAACGIRFVASDHIAHKGLASKLLLKIFRPILHTKGRMGIETTREIMTTLKNGVSVGLFPEGNRSFYGRTMEIPGVTGKLARRTGVKLVTWRFEGGYMTQPRWGKGFRRGKLTGRLMGVYQPEVLKAMTDAEVQKRIEEDLFEDAFLTQEREKTVYRSQYHAEGLESALYLCPVCGEIGRLKGEGERFSCACGQTYTLTTGMMLRDGEGRETTIADMAEKQRELLCEKYAACPPDEMLFSDRVEAAVIGEDHAVIKTIRGELQAYRAEFRFAGRTYMPSNIAGTAIAGRNTLIVHTKNASWHAEIRGDEFYSAIKYQNLYALMKERAGE